MPPVGGERVPENIGPALRVLERNAADRVLAPYAVAYRITFESRERIVATSLGQVRYGPHDRLVHASAAPAYVFVADSADDRRAVVSLAGSSRRVQAGDWAVYVPVASRR